MGRLGSPLKTSSIKGSSNIVNGYNGQNNVFWGFDFTSYQVSEQHHASVNAIGLPWMNAIDHKNDQFLLFLPFGRTKLFV